MGRSRKMTLSPGKKAWLTRRHKLTLSGLKRPSKAKGLEIKEIHQINGHGPYKHQWFVPSRRDPNKIHKVSERYDGVFICDCGKFIFQKGPVAEHKPCDHIRDVKKRV